MIEDTAEVLGRVRRFSVGAYVLFVIPVLITSGFRGVIGLTCSALVTIISFLWLEHIVEASLQPSPHLSAWNMLLRALARYILLGAALSVAVIVARFNPLSVLLGFSIVVVGIVGEAVYTSFAS